MKKVLKDVLDFVIKNKYIVSLIVIILILYALGILKFLAELVVLLLLIALAIYFGKKMQDSNFKISNLFNSNSEFKKEGNVYYYQGKNDKDKKTK